MSLVAWGYSSTLIAIVSHETRPMLWHLNASTWLLLLDWRRCVGNLEEGKAAHDVLVEQQCGTSFLCYLGQVLSRVLQFYASGLVACAAISHHLVA